MKMKSILPALLLLTILLTLNSCAPLGVTERQYGFVSGLLHGFLIYFAVLAKLFGMEFDLYAHNNTGLSYWIGFAIGVFGFGGGLFRTGRR